MIRSGFILLFLTLQIGWSQTFSSKIQEKLDKRQISEIDALYLEAVRVYDPVQLPEEYREDFVRAEKCGMALNYQLRSRWDAFSSEQQSFLKTHLNRPNLSDEIITPSGRFKIHYTTTGSYAVSTDDLDASGVPDYVEEVAASMDYVYTLEVETLGLNPPPDDRGVDGPEWDVYIKNFSDYGETVFDEMISSNPELWITYINLDNDYTYTETTGLDGMRVTCAHEFFHMIQLGGYNFRDADIFIMEASSTWMEDVAYDDINDYVFYLNHLIHNSNVSFVSVESSREYALCLWFHLLEKRLGTRDFMADFWDNIINDPAVSALDNTLRSYGTTFDEELSLFYGWNYMTGSRSDTVLYYPEGYLYPEMVDGDFDGVFALESTNNATGDVQPMAAQYHKFTDTGGTSYVLATTNLNRSSREQFTVVLLGENGQHVIALDDNVSAVYSVTNYRGWGGTAVVEQPNGVMDFLPLDIGSLDPDEADLPQSSPNPFVVSVDGLTTIPFFLGESGLMRIVIFTASGYRVWEDERFIEVGEGGDTGFFAWDGKNLSGETVASGTYVYVVTSDEKLIRRDKFAVIR